MTISPPSLKKTRKLTVNEQEFVSEMTRVDDDRPRTGTEAYRRAYRNENPNRQTCYNAASEILKRPHVKDAIAVVEAKIETDRRRASRGNAAAIQIKLWNIVDQDTTTTYEQIAALKTLASLLPKNAVESSPNEDSAASKAELVERLKLVLTDVPDAIDVTPESDVEVDAAVIDITSRVDQLTEDEPGEDSDDEPGIIPEY
jgi:hypothetical protein